MNPPPAAGAACAVAVDGCVVGVALRWIGAAVGAVWVGAGI